MRSMTWIVIGALAIGLAGCAAQPPEQPEAAPEEKPKAIANEDFDSGEPETVVESPETEEPEAPNESTAPDHG